MVDRHYAHNRMVMSVNAWLRQLRIFGRLGVGWRTDSSRYDCSFTYSALASFRLDVGVLTAVDPFASRGRHSGGQRADHPIDAPL